MELDKKDYKQRSKTWELREYYLGNINLIEALNELLSSLCSKNKILTAVGKAAENQLSVFLVLFSFARFLYFVSDILSGIVF